MQNHNCKILKYFCRRPTRRIAPFDYEWCLKLHAEMFGHVWPWAGQLRQLDDFIYGVPHREIRPMLENLLTWLGAWSAHVSNPKTRNENKKWKMPIAARLHHGTLHIHPFVDGNARWSRLLSNIWLRQHDAPAIDWPERLFDKRCACHAHYMRALHAADAGNDAPLIALQRRYCNS